MVAPVVQTVAPNPAAPRQQIIVTGTGFGFVVDAFFEDTAGVLKRAAFTQVFDGQHALLTVPPDITVDVDYTVVLVTTEDEVSTNSAGLLHVIPIPGAVTAVEPVDTPDPFPLPDPGVSIGLDRLRKRTRLELGDPKTPFQAQVVGDGTTTTFDLPVRHIQADDLVVKVIPAGASATNAVTLATPTDYVLDQFAGEITLTAPLGDGARMFVTGTRHRFFDDATLDTFIEEAFVQITLGRKAVTTNISAFGYRVYDEFFFDYSTLREVEYLPTAILAEIQALWVLATDSAYEIDITTDGASIPRSERYRQLMAHIAAETARFTDMAEALNIGIHRIEMDTLRRVSRTTGRLVPIYVEKEYDDHTLPVRVLPGVDHGVGEGVEFVDPYYQAGANYGGGFGP